MQSKAIAWDERWPVRLSTFTPGQKTQCARDIYGERLFGQIVMNQTYSDSIIKLRFSFFAFFNCLKRAHHTN